MWLAHDTQTKNFVALKIQKSAKNYTEAAQDEIKLLQEMALHDEKKSQGIIHLLDNFVISGPNGKRMLKKIYQIDRCLYGNGSCWPQYAISDT